jgi:hypothetical protein
LLDNDNNDNTSKKVFDYNINENQFENKIIKRTTAERLPIWVEYIKKKEEKYKKEKSNK